LNFYKDDERLGHVAGNNPVTLPNINGDYFFSVKHRTLAWATWKRAWENRIKNIQEISDKDFEKVIHSTLMHRNFANRQIELFKYQKYKQDYPNWDFMWQLNCWMNDLLAVYYKYNLVKKLKVCVYLSKKICLLGTLTLSSNVKCYGKPWILKNMKTLL
jgi:hypothetical protein